MVAEILLCECGGELEVQSSVFQNENGDSEFDYWQCSACGQVYDSDGNTTRR